MPNTLDQSVPDATQWRGVHIDDFTAGIYDASFVSTESPILPAPPGAATASDTWCCIAYPTGGIGPLPRLADWYITPQYPNVTTRYPTTSPAFITMMIVNPGVKPTEVIYSLEIQNAAGTSVHSYTVFSYKPTGHHLNALIHGQTSAGYKGIFASPFPFWTKIGFRTAPPTTEKVHTSNPHLVFPASITTDPHGVQGHIWVYPDPHTPTAYKLYDLIKGATSTPAAGSGQVLGYDGRVVCLSAVGTSWPTGVTLTRNETICWTTPPESLRYLNQREAFVPENPFGYGAWGSVSAGELFLVKKWGGGVFITGDIDTPTSVTTLTGVEPTGLIVGRACASEEGTYYCAQGRGAWIWNGGNTSQKISTQLRDDFFTVETKVVQSDNMGFFVQKWGDLIVFSGNYVYNRRTKSWWCLYPNKKQNTTTLRAKKNFFHYCPGRNYHELFASPLRIEYVTTGGTIVPTPTATGFAPFGTRSTHFLYKFTMNQPATLWRWKSLPIHVSPDGRRVADVRQITIRISQPTQKGTSHQGHVTIQVFGFGGSGGTTYKTATSPTPKLTVDPKPFRFNAGVSGVTDIVIQLTAHGTGTNGAPIVHSIDIEYQLRAQDPIAN